MHKWLNAVLIFCILPFLSFHFEDGAGELVRTRGWLSATGVAEQLGCNVFGLHAFAKFCNGLEVSVASTRKANVADCFSVTRELNCRCACTFCLKCFFHRKIVVVIVCDAYHFVITDSDPGGRLLYIVIPASVPESP